MKVDGENMTTTKNRTEDISSQKKIAELLATIDDLTEKVDMLEKKIDAQKVVGLSGIDGSVTFQSALTAAITGVFATQNTGTLIHNKKHVTSCAKAALDLAEHIHNAICERYCVEQ